MKELSLNRFPALNTSIAQELDFLLHDDIKYPERGMESERY
jgi:hypothetical protein